MKWSGCDLYTECSYIQLLFYFRVFSVLYKSPLSQLFEVFVSYVVESKLHLKVRYSPLQILITETYLALSGANQDVLTFTQKSRRILV